MLTLSSGLFPLKLGRASRKGIFSAPPYKAKWTKVGSASLLD